MQKLLSIFGGLVLVILLIYIAVIAFGFEERDATASDAVILEKSGTSLQIPAEYISPYSFPWIENAEGLDADLESIRIHVPIEEVLTEIPKDISSDYVLVSLLTILSREQISRFNRSHKNQSEEINKPSSRFANSYFAPDELTNLFRLYMGTDTDNVWYLMKTGERPVAPTDIVAICRFSEKNNIRCRIMSFLIGNISVETSMDIDLIPHLEIIKNHFEKLITEWSSTSDI